MMRVKKLFVFPHWARTSLFPSCLLEGMMKLFFGQRVPKGNELLPSLESLAPVFCPTGD